MRHCYGHQCGANCAKCFGQPYAIPGRKAHADKIYLCGHHREPKQPGQAIFYIIRLSTNGQNIRLNNWVKRFAWTRNLAVPPLEDRTNYTKPKFEQRILNEFLGIEQKIKRMRLSIFSIFVCSLSVLDAALWLACVAQCLECTRLNLTFFYCFNK